MSSFAAESCVPPYPEGTPYRENVNGTYWPNLSPSAQAALDVIIHYVSEHHIDMTDLCITTLDQRLTMLRYLRANNFDTKKTIAHMLKNIEWRANMKVKELVKQVPEEILGFDMSELVAVFPHWQYGFDKTGRPVVYKQYAKFDASRVKKLAGGNYDRVVKYHIWEQEAAARLYLTQTERLGHLIETGTGIVDVKDMSLWQITRDFLALTRSIADVDQGQYPETLGRIYIVNAPSAFPMVYGMIKPWLDPVVAAKIFVLGGPKEYQPVLIDFIGKENLPATYGGDMPALDAAIHPYALTIERDYSQKPHPHDDSFLTEASSTAESIAETDAQADQDGSEDAILHKIEEMVHETQFHPSDNPNHDAEGHAVEPDLVLDAEAVPA